MEETKNYDRKYSDDKKMEIVHKAVTSNVTIKEVADEYGVTPDTVSRWVKKYMPDGLSMESMAVMTNEEIVKAYDRSATIGKMMIIQKIITLVPGERDLDKLSRVLKELKSAAQTDDPGKRESPWAVQVNVAIQNQLKNQKE